MIKILEPDLTGNEKQYLNECISEGWISSQGRFVAEFEKLALRGIEHRECVATANGTVAIHLALAALGIKAGDEVIVPELTFGATLNAISYTGAIPVIVDIDPNDWNICRIKLKKALSNKTRAIMPVALFGNPSGILEIVNWAEGNGILSVIDAAEAVGAKVNGKDVGSFGDAVTYSYFGNKTITTGEGGAVIFKDKAVAKRARIMRDHGMTPGRRYHHEVVGYNYRLTNLQAAIGVAQYERLDDILAHRAKITKRYLKNLSKNDFQTQVVSEGNISSNWIFSLLVGSERIEKLMLNLSANDIEYRRCFEPMSKQPAFKNAIVSSTVNISKAMYDSMILLPTHNNLSFDDVNFISNIVIDSIGKK